jgi:hypothetical protein
MSSTFQPIGFQAGPCVSHVMLPDKFPVNSLDLEDVDLQELPSMLSNCVGDSDDSSSSGCYSFSRIVFSSTNLNIPGIVIPESRIKTLRATKTPSSSSSSMSNSIRRSTSSPTDELFLSEVSSKELWINQYKSGNLKSAVEFEM